MVEDIFINKLIESLANLMNMEFSSDQLKDMMESMFGVEKTEIKMFNSNESNQTQLEAYVYNTKKPYIDNEISDYSAFPELLNYKNEGYSSCMVIPVIGRGKTLGEVVLLSSKANKFSKDISNLILLSVILFSLKFSEGVSKRLSDRSTTFFDTAFNSSYPQVIVNAGDKIVKFNKAFVEMTGDYPEGNIKDMIGMDFKSLSDLINGKYSDITLKSRKVVRVRSKAISKNLVYVILTDMTDSSKLNSLSKLMKQQSNFAVFYMDSKFNVVNVSGSLYDNFNEIIGMEVSSNFKDILPDNSKANIDKLNVSESISFNSVINFPNRDLLCNVILLKYPIGYISILSNLSKDLTIQNLSSRISNFLNFTSDLIIKVNELGNITDCNESAIKDLGYSKKSDLYGKGIRSLFFESDLEALDTNFSFMKKGGSVNSISGNLVERSNDTLHVLYSIIKTDDEDSGYIFLFRNMQPQMTIKDLEEEIHRDELKSKKYKNVSDLKSEFIYNITHELKTPLTNIKGFTKLMLNGEFGDTTDEQKEYLNTILDESDRLMLIISQVLDAAKLEADKVKLDLKEINLKDLYSNPTIKSLEDSAKNKGLYFNWDIAYDVPNIEADLNRLIQVFVNIIGNSIKFTEKGGIDVRIIKRSKRYIQVEISDTGIGISDEDKRKIFKKFYQAQNRNLTKPDKSGTGLGLAITRDIISLHGGKIKFDSKLGEGTKFLFTLPVTHRRRTSSSSVKN